MKRRLIATLTAVLAMAAPQTARAQPTLEAQQPAIDFGKVLIGTIARDSNSNRLRGVGQLTIVDMRAVGGDRTRFSIFTPGRKALPLTLKAPGSVSHIVNFFPDTARNYSSTLVIQVFGGQTVNYPVRLKGEGVHNIKLGYLTHDSGNPQGFDFGRQPVGSTTRLAITFTNSSNRDRSVATMLPRPDSGFSTNLPWGSFTMKAGSSHTFAVDFKPTAAKSYRSVIRIDYGRRNVAGVTLRGIGFRPGTGGGSGTGGGAEGTGNQEGGD